MSSSFITVGASVQSFLPEGGGLQCSGYTEIPSFCVPLFIAPNRAHRASSRTTLNKASLSLSIEFIMLTGDKMTSTGTFDKTLKTPQLAWNAFVPSRSTHPVLPSLACEVHQNN